MAIDVTGAARTLIYDGLAQNDINMAHHQLIDLDTSNLDLDGAPPTIHPVPHQWLHDWDSTTRLWAATQPSFSHISGFLTRAQQDSIIHLGVVSTGTWQASIVQPTYLPTLDLIRAPVGNVNLNSKRIVSLANPVDPQDAVNKRFMDFLLQGLQVKEAVRCASTGARIPSGLLPNVDGVALTVGDRVLLKGAGDRSFQHGIYTASTGSWSRTLDADTGEELERAYVTVREGLINSGTSWVQSLEVVNPSFDEQLWLLFATATGEPGPPGADGEGVPPGGDIGQILAKRTSTNFDTEWIDPSGGFGTPPPVYTILQTGIANPAGIPFDGAHLEGKMAGLAGYFTPHETGKVIVTIAGFLYTNSAAGAVTARMVVGSGTAPANNTLRPTSTSALVGAIAGLSPIGANRGVPFSLTAAIGTLTPGIQFWFDLLVQPISTGTAFVAGVAISAYEIP